MNNISVYFDLVYGLLRKIPKGKVATYGQIASIVNKSILESKNYGSKLKITPRMVGKILHNNSDPKNIPCHRVVRSDGTLASGYAFGGKNVQKRKLVEEGIEFKKGRINLENFLWAKY